MADPYFSLVSLQLRAKEQTLPNLNSAYLSGFNFNTTNPLGGVATITNEFVFQSTRSFKVIPGTGFGTRENNSSEFGRFGLSDFTIEGRFCLTAFNASTDSVLIDCWNASNGWKLSVSTAGVIKFTEKSLAVNLQGGTFLLNTNHHIEVSRVSGTLYLFLDGVLLSSYASLQNHTWNAGTSPIYTWFGGQYNTRVTTTDSTGYFDDVRFTKFVGRHTANFTPPITTDFTEYSVQTDGSIGLVNNIQSNQTDFKSEAIGLNGAINTSSNVLEGFIKEEMYQYGPNQMQGIARLDAVPGEYRVSLLDRDSKQLIRRTKSAANGLYVFDYLKSETDYVAICEDDKTKPVRKNARIRDLINFKKLFKLTEGSLNSYTNISSDLLLVEIGNIEQSITITFQPLVNVIFMPTSVTLSPSNTKAEVTIICTQAGSYEISTTNSLGLTNPNPLTYVCANEAVSNFQRTYYDSGNTALGCYYQNVGPLAISPDLPTLSQANIKFYRKDNLEKVGEAKTSTGVDDSDIIVDFDFNGPNGSNVFIDKSGKTWTIEPATNPVITTTDPPFSGSSLLLNNVSWIQSGTSTDWAFGLGDFYIGALINLTAAPVGFYDSILGNWSTDSGFCIFITPDLKIQLSLNDLFIISADPAIVVGTWQYIEVIRVSGVASILINGVVVATGAINSSVDRNDFMRIGSNAVGANDCFNGKIARLLMRKGSGVSIGSVSTNNPRKGLASGIYRFDTPYPDDLVYVIE